MESQDAKHLLFALMLKHGLMVEGWTPVINPKLHRLLGVCKWHKKRIELNELFVLCHDEEFVKQVCMHEIAHALCPVTGHGKAWKEVAVRIGVDEEFQRASNRRSCSPEYWQARQELIDRGVIKGKLWERLGRKVENDN